MPRDGIVLALTIIALTPGVVAQFYDIFQALQPIVHSYTSYTEPPLYEVRTTRRPKPSHRQRTGDRNLTTEIYPALDGYLNDGRRIDKQTKAPASEWYTTARPGKTSKAAYSPQGSRNTAREVASNPKDPSRGSAPSRVTYNDAITFIDEKRREDGNRIPERPHRVSTSRPVKPNRYTTQNPFLNRPGVRPAVVDDGRPPNTNRPPTKRPETAPGIQDQTPELITAPDEDSMSEVERRRYIEISERMCDKYKRLNVKQLQAIPLVPSPVPVQVNVTTCAPSTVPLVVGGVVVSIRDFPHMALVGWPKLRSSGYAWRCGGSLVSSRYVLTAAHCAYEERDNSIVMGTPRVVQLGSSYLDDPGALVVRVAAVVRHPKYKQPKAYYDIALIKLATAVSFSQVVRPACLGAPPAPNEPVIATGWGRTEFGGEQSLELRSVAVQVWGNEECARALGTSRKLPDGPSTDSQICAGARQGGKDTCQGDSGGPAQVQDGCQWRVVAVTSLGRSCGAPNTPALYATVKIPFVSSVVFRESGDGEDRQTSLNRAADQRRVDGRLTIGRRPTAKPEDTRQQNSYSYNQNSGDYSNNYDIYNNQPYYNEPPTWF